MKTYEIPVLFKEGDIVYDPQNKHYKRCIIRFDEKDGMYHCDGSTFPITDQFKYKKVSSIDDLFIGDTVRVPFDPNCYQIVQFINNTKVILHQIHGDNYNIIVPLNNLLDINGYSFNII